VLLSLITTCSCVEESAVAVLALLMWGCLMVASSNGVDPKLQLVLIVGEAVLVLVGRSCVVGHPLPGGRRKWVMPLRRDIATC